MIVCIGFFLLGGGVYVICFVSLMVLLMYDVGVIVSRCFFVFCGIVSVLMNFCSVLCVMFLLCVSFFSCLYGFLML